MSSKVRELIEILPQRGTLEMILLRPDKKVPVQNASMQKMPMQKEPMKSVEAAEVRLGQGLVGDRFRGRPDSKRQVTLFQAENLPVLASLLHRDEIDPKILRRNLIVRGINLHALSGRRFYIGDVVLEGAAQCHPCSQMEAALGPGGFNAMRGIGGLCARVVEEGRIQIGDSVFVD